jgi:hypothetical protein
MKKVLFSIAIVAAGLLVASCGNKSAANAEGADSTAVEEQAAEEQQAEKEKPGLIIVKEKTFEGEDLRVAAEFTYPTDKDIKVAERGENGVSVGSVQGNWMLLINMIEYASYDEVKEKAKNYPNYKELKIGDYEAWYETRSGFNLRIYFEKCPNTQSRQRYVNICIRARKMLSDGPTGLELFESNEDIKAIINSVKYKGAIKEN